MFTTTFTALSFACAFWCWKPAPRVYYPPPPPPLIIAAPPVNPCGTIVYPPGHGFGATVPSAPGGIIVEPKTIDRKAMPKVEGKPKTDRKVERTLYERLGGEAAIRAVVDDFTIRVSNNPKVNFTRKGTNKEWKATPENVAKMKERLVQFVGQVSGGPQKYAGMNMKDLHRGMEITQAEFDAAAADLKASLDKLKVPAREQQELMKAVAATAPDIVEKKRN